MKRAVLWCVCTVSLVAVVLCCCGVGLEHYPDTLIDGISFGISRRGLEQVMGAPVHTAQDICDTEMDEWTYQMNVAGEPAEVSYYFNDRNRMEQIVISLNLANMEQTNAAFENVFEKAVGKYEGEENYYCNEIQRTGDSEYEVTLGSRNGAVGIYVNIHVANNEIVIINNYMI